MKQGFWLRSLKNPRQTEFIVTLEALSLGQLPYIRYSYQSIKKIHNNISRCCLCYGVQKQCHVISGLLERYPNASYFIETTKPLLESMVPLFFYGAIHAEATLMGLISFLSLDDHERNRHDAKISNPDTFREF